MKPVYKLTSILIWFHSKQHMTDVITYVGRFLQLEAVKKKLFVKTKLICLLRSLDLIYSAFLIQKGLALSHMPFLPPGKRFGNTFRSSSSWKRLHFHLFLIWNWSVSRSFICLKSIIKTFGTTELNGWTEKCSTNVDLALSVRFWRIAASRISGEISTSTAFSARRVSSVLFKSSRVYACIVLQILMFSLIHNSASWTFLKSISAVQTFLL